MLASSDEDLSAPRSGFKKRENVRYEQRDADRTAGQEKSIGTPTHNPEPSGVCENPTVSRRASVEIKCIFTHTHTHSQVYDQFNQSAVVFWSLLESWNKPEGRSFWPTRSSTHQNKSMKSLSWRREWTCLCFVLQKQLDMFHQEVSEQNSEIPELPESPGHTTGRDVRELPASLHPVTTSGFFPLYLHAVIR